MKKVDQIEQTLSRVTGLQRVEGNSNSRHQVVLAKDQSIQRHNQAPIAPAPTWNRQLLRPNHCNRKPKTKPMAQLLVQLD